jgi:hypothetical protein
MSNVKVKNSVGEWQRRWRDVGDSFISKTQKWPSACPVDEAQGAARLLPASIYWLFEKAASRSCSLDGTPCVRCCCASLTGRDMTPRRRDVCRGHHHEHWPSEHATKTSSLTKKIKKLKEIVKYGIRGIGPIGMRESEWSKTKYHCSLIMSHSRAPGCQELGARSAYSIKWFQLEHFCVVGHHVAWYRW